MTENPNQNYPGIAYAADIIKASSRAVVLTGAGISTASGIPDFRSPKSGLWQRYDPFEVASLSSFRYQPEKFFKWIQPLFKDILKAKPNAAHIAIAELEAAGYVNKVITQNIDALHQKAGSHNVIEVHGTFNTLVCIGCYRKQPSSRYLEAYIQHAIIPTCPYCGKILKPNIILFGEQLPAKAWLLANEISKSCDLMIVVGSSLEVLPVASLPMRAIENGAHLIIINHSETYLDVRADVVFNQDASIILPILVRQIVP